MFLLSGRGAPRAGQKLGIKPIRKAKTMKAFKQTIGSLTLVAGLLLLSSLSWGQIWSRIVVEETLSIQAVPADKVPRYGTFWSLQRTNCAPSPFNPFPDLPVYYLG